MPFKIQDIGTLFYTKDFGGRSYNEDWVPIDAMGNALGGKDWAANAAYAAQTNTQNPYTNEAGASQYDKSGLIPGNEPGSTLPRVTGPTRKSSAAAAPAAAAPTPSWGLDMSQPSWSSVFSATPYPATTPTPVSSSPLQTNQVSRVSATDSGPRRISDTLVSSLGQDDMTNEEDALSELAKLLQGVLR